MTRWFAALPVHRKLVVVALAASTAALITAGTGFVAFDAARFRSSALDETQSLAQIIAVNTEAAVAFDNPEDASAMLASVRARPVVRLACVYRLDGTVLAAYEQTPALRCPHDPASHAGWASVGQVVPVTLNGQLQGRVYVQRALSDLGARVALTTAAGGLMLIVAGALALGLAHRLQRGVSRPITELAQVARSVGHGSFDMPHIEAAPDETGDLVRAFSDMVSRLRDASDRLVSSNEALRHEIDERRRMQAERETLLAREREASRLKDEFLAAVSHELRTPLNAILGWTQILESTTPSRDTLQKAVASLARNAQAQNRVIEDLIDVSRVITGKLRLVFETVDLRTVAEGAFETIAPGAVAKGIHLHLELPPQPCTVRGDQARLQQVVWNLLSNAVKFTPQGGAVTMRVTSDGQRCQVTVTDSGIGIPGDFLPHVFDRFRQADGSTTREHGGLGLGLAIVKELVELHGGTAEASSAGGGKGAVFTISLPAASRDTAVAAEQPGAGGLPRLEGVDVLAVDDNADARDILTTVLGRAGAAVQVAGSGLEALNLRHRRNYDVVLCDLAMPQMDGFDLLRRFREIDADAGRVTPVLAVTAHASEDYRARCFSAGFDGHIAKPFQAAELLRAVALAARRTSHPDSD